MTAGAAGAAPAQYDVIVVGATPAGSTAALRAGALGLRTLLLERGIFPRGGRELGWLGPAGVALCGECGLDAPAVRAAPFSGLRLHSWDLQRSRAVGGAKLAGWLVEQAWFEQSLWEAARRSGAEVMCHAAPAELSLGETCVDVRLEDGRRVRGRLLLVADGLDSPTAALARLPLARRADGVADSAQLVFEREPEAVGLDVAVGGRRAVQLVTVMRSGTTVHVTLTAHEPEQPADVQLREFCAASRKAGLIPPGPVPPPVRTRTPSGVALDLETHVGKRCILVGEAGGFVSAFSQERIYPAMRSGWIAAEAAARALRAAVVQDELQSFSTAWRAELADYLRMPNTELSLLMPLVFNNAQMSERLARAFLLGQGF